MTLTWNWVPELQKPAGSILHQRRSGHNDRSWQQGWDDNQSSLTHSDLSEWLIDDNVLRGEIDGKLTRVSLDLYNEK